MTTLEIGNLVRFDQAERNMRVTGLLSPPEFEFFLEEDQQKVEEAREIFDSAINRLGGWALYPATRQCVDLHRYEEGPNDTLIESMSIHVGRTRNGVVRTNLCMITTEQGTAFEQHQDFVLPGRTLKEPAVGDIELVRHWNDAQWETFADVGKTALGIRKRSPESLVA